MKIKDWIYATMVANVVLMAATAFLPIEVVERLVLLVLQAACFVYLIGLARIQP
jgi:hypothetical protein